MQGVQAVPERLIGVRIEVAVAGGTQARKPIDVWLGQCCVRRFSKKMWPRMSRTGLAAPSQGRMRPPWPYHTKETQHDDPADGQRPHRCRRP